MKELSETRQVNRLYTILYASISLMLLVAYALEVSAGKKSYSIILY